jgi:hypothetical protein
MPLMITLLSIVVALGRGARQAFNLDLRQHATGIGAGDRLRLFVVSRFREERGRGRDMDAIAATRRRRTRRRLSGTTWRCSGWVVPNRSSPWPSAIVVGAVLGGASATLLPARR